MMRVQAAAPDATWVHCSIHREALAASLLDSKTFWTQQVNFEKARPLNSHIFTALCSEMGSENEIFLLHTEVRWLSRGKIMTRFFDLRDELEIFISDHHFQLSEHLPDEEFLTVLPYLSDIFSHLNELNLGLQGVSATVFNVQDKVGAMKKKLKRHVSCMDSNQTEVFHCCMTLCVQMNLHRV